jgi:2-keto-4-pentenoate hydratase/2-oxohepta-3-ene-1,7-dioic acid hydratase in catechol pathway
MRLCCGPRSGSVGGAFMKLVSFVVAGKPGFGVVLDDNRVADLSASWSSLRASLPHLKSDLFTAALKNAPILALDSIELTVPIPDADKIICAGLNFREHVQESGHVQNAMYPSIFLRSISTFVGHEQKLLKPEWTDTFDYEAELAIVIGKAGRYIKSEQAMEHVAGYTLLMDGSVRSVQFEHSLAAGKNFYRSGAIGPWLVTADEIPDPTSLELIGRANGVQRQRASISDLIFDISALISYSSRIGELLPGDIISVGTPSGVGAAMKPVGYLAAGDIFETEVPGIGVLRNEVAIDPLSVS